MRLAPVGVIWMLAMMVLASGCNPASPLDTFKSLVDTEESALRSKYPAIPVLKFAFDVKKTDSLASPYLGTINIDTTWRQFPNEINESTGIYETDARISMYYAMQDGKWVYKNFEWVKSNWRVLKDVPGGVCRQTAAQMNQQAGIPVALEMKPEIMWQTLNEIMSKTP